MFDDCMLQWYGITTLFGIAAFVVFLLFLSMLGLFMNGHLDLYRAPSLPPRRSEVIGCLDSFWLRVISLAFK